MSKFIAGLREILGRIFVTDQEAEYRFLSQAQSHAQLEELQRIWDQRHRRNW
jgi:hypothetical protein